MFEASLPPLPATWECDLATGELNWSAGVYDLFGIAPGTRLVRSEIVAMYCEESRAWLESVRRAAIEKAGSFTFDARIRRTDGAWRWMRLTADVECDGGRPVRLYGTKLDVTGEVEAGARAGRPA